jgi:uncharacterized Zn finger protein (UPF0148 family)
MACPKCKTKRLFRYSEVVCPVCANIKTVNSSSEIAQRETALAILIRQLENLLHDGNQQLVRITAIKGREKISKSIIQEAWIDPNEVEQWQALRYLIEKCDGTKHTGTYSEHFFNELQNISFKIVKLRNEIGKLKKSQAVIIELDNNKEFCLTEDFPLSFIPKKVEESIKQALKIDSTPQDQWIDDIKQEHTETAQTQVLALEPASGMIKSEKISRQLRVTSNDRIFPHLNGNEKAQKFVNMTSALLDGLLVYAWKTLRDNSVVEANKSTVCSFGSFSKFSAMDIDWYFETMKNFIISTGETEKLSFPFATIQMLQLSVYKWSGLPQVGKDLNFIGKMVEDLIFNLIQSFNGQTVHPITKEPLVRVIDPLTKEEIADIMIFDTNNIVIIESKFWDCPNLADLEEQLENFRKKTATFSLNRKRLGFPEANVHPVFYTPFPPYSTWKGVQLIPSQFLVGWFVGDFFGPKKPALVEENTKLGNLVASQDYPFLYPVDANELDSTIPVNTLRINDGWVEKYNDREICLKVMNPIGEPIVIILDITSKTFSELKASNIIPGDFLRFGCINHSGSWSITQFLYFKKIDEKDPKRKVKELLGNTGIATEVISAFETYNLDIFKFIEFCKTRTPSLSLLNEVVAARLGSVLTICDTNDFVTQCKCGNIVGLQSAFLEQRKAISGGQILCGACLQKFLSNE